MVGTCHGITKADCLSTQTMDRMLGRRLPLGLTFLLQDTWANMSNAAKVLDSFIGYVGIRDNIVMSVPLNQPGSTLAQVAAGTYDSHFIAAGTLIAQYFPNAIMRLGWEMNGGYFAWKAYNVESDFIAAWIHVRALLKAISPGFTFCWNPDKLAARYTGANCTDAPDCYPGDAYVDVIGIENYNQWRNSVDAPTSGSTFPYVTAEPDVKKVERWQNCGLGTLSATFQGAGFPRPYCLAWAAAFASQHGKPLSIVEWATGYDSATIGRHCGDDVYFVEQTAQWILDNGVVWHCYYDKAAEGGSYNCKLSYDAGITGVATGDPTDEKPRAAAAFKAAFGAA